MNILPTSFLSLLLLIRTLVHTFFDKITQGVSTKHCFPIEKCCNALCRNGRANYLILLTIFSRVLNTFLKEQIYQYKTGRDLPAQSYTSRLSPYIHFGELSIRQIWHAVDVVFFRVLFQALRHGRDAQE